MSRSYKKVAKQNIAYGSNTEYYRNRARHTRTLNKQNLKNALQYEEDVIDDFIINMKPNQNTHFDEWNEPTDGSYIIDETNPGSYKNKEVEEIKERIKQLKRK